MQTDGSQNQWTKRTGCAPPLNGPLADVRSGARAVCPGPILTRSGLRRAPPGGRRPGASGSRPAVRRGARRRPAAVREVSSGGRRGRRPSVGRRCLVCRHASSPLLCPASHATRHRRSVAGIIVNEAHSSTDSSRDAGNDGCAAAHCYLPSRTGRAAAPAPTLREFSCERSG